MAVALVTGGGTGIGRGLAIELAQRGHRVIVASRSEPKPFDAALRSGITWEHLDLRDAKSIEKLAAKFAEQKKMLLVHNAGTIEPMGPLMQISPPQWQAALETNLSGPLMLTQALVHALVGGRVLHISSGAAHRPVQGWGAYCTSKAAFFMLYQLLALELKSLNIAVGSARPGVVDTPMQELIRSSSLEHFPGVEKFRQLASSGGLSSPQRVGRFLAWLLLDVAPELFSAKEWDVRDDEHQGKWN